MADGTVRGDLVGGQLFSCSPGGELCCLALDPDNCDKLKLFRSFRGRGVRWHVYLPAGQLSWCWEDSIVYVA